MEELHNRRGRRWKMVTGVLCAIADRKLSSDVGFKGICRKVLIFIMIGIANVIDVNVLGEPGVLRTAVIFFYISNEGLSLVENSAYLGLPVPESMKRVLTDRGRVVQQACAWIGRKEADGSFREIIDIYNAHKPLPRGYYSTRKLI